jgi:hypothetical protein
LPFRAIPVIVTAMENHVGAILAQYDPAQLAALTGVRYDTVSAWRTGRYIPATMSLMPLALAIAKLRRAANGSRATPKDPEVQTVLYELSAAVAADKADRRARKTSGPASALA